MAKKKGTFGVDNYTKRKRKKRKGQYKKSMSKSQKRSFKKYNRQGRV